MALRRLSVIPCNTVTVPDPNVLAACVFVTGIVDRRPVQ